MPSCPCSQMDKKSEGSKPSYSVKKANKNQMVQGLKNQVGGHCKLIKLSNGTIGKPLILREAQMYQVRPSKIAPFMANYKGTISLSGQGELHHNRNDDAFIILEDLTRNYEKPCILDLKMGTRMYADFASASKIESQSRKSRQTTSSRLGVRMCGSLWYNPRSGQTFKTDKYHGRRLDASSFESEFLNFFTDGFRLRKPVLYSLLQQLQKLRSIIAKLDSFRFYSSSLLIVYEGKDKQSKSRNFDSSVSFEDMSADEDASVHLEGELKNYPKVTVKMIDFANCTFRGFLNDSVIHVGPDLGYLQGLDTLIHILLQTLEDDSQQ